MKYAHIINDNSSQTLETVRKQCMCERQQHDKVLKKSKIIKWDDADETTHLMAEHNPAVKFCH